MLFHDKEGAKLGGSETVLLGASFDWRVGLGAG